MTRQLDRTELDRIVELVLQHGTDVLGEAFAMILNHAMNVERSQVLGAEPYERTEERRGYANGHKPKILKTAAGALTVAVPKRGNYAPAILCEIPRLIGSPNSDARTEISSSARVIPRRGPCQRTSIGSAARGVSSSATP